MRMYKRMKLRKSSRKTKGYGFCDEIFNSQIFIFLCQLYQEVEIICVSRESLLLRLIKVGI